VPRRLNCAQCGFGHENRVYLSRAGVVSIKAVLLWQGMDQKIQSRRQLCHVTVLQDYLDLESPLEFWVVLERRETLMLAKII
jgi:hypothetical protein